MRFLSQGSVWQLSSEDRVRESEDSAVTWEAGLLTDPQRRHAHVYVGEVTNWDWNGEEEQRMKELSEGLREIKVALDEMRAQWAEKMQGVTGLSAKKCFRQVKAGQMTVTEARSAFFDGKSEEETSRFEQLIRCTYARRTDEVGNTIGEPRLDHEDGPLADLAGLTGFWEQDELRRIKEEQAREEGGAVRLVTRTWNELGQLTRGGL
jgi:hypothetical protein